jgi:hypothetical protein
VRNGAVHLQSVKEIATEADNAAVDGVQVADVVAISGFDKIQDGTNVAVLNPESSPNGSSTEHTNGAGNP